LSFFPDYRHERRVEKRLGRFPHVTPQDLVVDLYHMLLVAHNNLKLCFNEGNELVMYLPCPVAVGIHVLNVFGKFGCGIWQNRRTIFSRRRF
jgi:hypothetical protein